MIEAKITSAKKNKLATHFWQKAEFDHFGIIPFLLVIIGMAGGLAIGFEAHGQVAKLLLVALPSVVALAIIVVASSMRLIFLVALVALICDLIVIFWK